MSNWRISTCSGALLAAYFIPTWTIAAFKIMISPIHGLFDRPNISLGMYMSEYLHLQALGMVRFAWLLALAKLTVVAFFALFTVFITRVKMRESRECDEPLAMALTIAGVVSFGGMVLASRVHEFEAMRLHATELLLLIGTAIVMAVEMPTATQPQADRVLPAATAR